MGLRICMLVLPNRWFEKPRQRVAGRPTGRPVTRQPRPRQRPKPTPIVAPRPLKSARLSVAEAGRRARQPVAALVASVGSRCRRAARRGGRCGFFRGEAAQALRRRGIGGGEKIERAPPPRGVARGAAQRGGGGERRGSRRGRPPRRAAPLPPYPPRPRA